MIHPLIANKYSCVLTVRLSFSNYEQEFIQTLHQKGQLIPEQPPGEKNLLLQLAIDPTHTPLEETSQATSFILYRKL